MSIRNPSRRRVTAAPLVRTTIVLPGDLVEATGDGLRVDSVALCEQIRSVSKTRLPRRLGTLSADAMAATDSALAISLALNTGP